MYRQEMAKVTEERIRGMVEIRDCVRELIDLQLKGRSDGIIVEQQVKLNNLYDKFTKKYGLINSQANKSAFKEDSGYYLLAALEIVNDKGELERKADMFTKRTVSQKRVITHVDTASEALAVSIAEKARVDLDFMAQLTGFTEERIIADLRGAIYQVPYAKNMDSKPVYVTADEYLSGDIRKKLSAALLYQNSLDNPMSYADNVEALKAAIPTPLEASDIDIKINAPWLNPEYIREFVIETLKPSRYMREALKVQYSNVTAEWQLYEGRATYGEHNNSLATMTFGTERINAFEIVQKMMNMRDITIHDWETVDGSERKVVNEKETMLAREKEEKLKEAFAEWIFKDYERREDLVTTYNELFNSVRPREYDGSHINFVGMNPEVTLNEHQVNAIAHCLYGGNTLLAHEVGAGKTWEMCAAVMEGKRLGLHNKALMCVPNHITVQ
jgi:N12 class adenine-specific DNA methylase